MIRLLVLTACLLTLAFAAALNLIHAQAGEDYALRVLLTSDGCAMPCLLGMSLNRTTRAQALDSLQRAAWVDMIDEHPYAITWRWRDAPPSLGSSAGYNSVSLLDDTIVYMQMETHIPFGDVWLAYGQPDVVVVERIPAAKDFVAIFAQQSVWARFTLPCPTSLRDLWQRPVSLVATRENYLPDQLLTAVHTPAEVLAAGCAA